jgi:AraC-like DNA-binding protein
MPNLISTDDVDQSEKFDYYRDAVLGLPVPVEIRCREPGTFHAALHITSLDDMPVVSLESRACTYQVARTPLLIRRADPESYRLVLNVRGRSGLNHHHQDVTLDPGDLLLCDTSFPFHGWRGSRTEGIERWIMATFPRRKLPLHPDRVRCVLGARLCGTDGVNALLRDYLRRIADDSPHHNAATAHGLAAVMLDLLAVVLADELDMERFVPPESRDRTLLVRMQAFIDDHLSDPNLTPNAVATAHHVSTRTLQRVFQGNGLTVSGWIREQRLARCRRDLADPRLGQRPVHAVAARWGYVDAAHFSRAFHAAYGIGPLAFRQHETGLSH